MITRQREHGTMDHWPKTGDERINAFRQIVKDGAYAKIDDIMIDLFSASVVVKIYDALNDKNKEKFANFRSNQMAYIAFSLMKKQDES